MEIKKIEIDKKQFLNLLLLADEQEDMIDRYLDHGDMFALYHGDLKSVCVVTCEPNGICELKNIATYRQYQHQGYGKYLVNHISGYYKGKYQVMFVGTGESPVTISFYKACGFIQSHRVKNFFTDNYDHPIFECGVQLVDMIYLKKEL
ncbi:N-acetyltransferase [Sporomusa sp. KB1]|jgi:GNAT superfamily N-acetyltransferase|uniref:GNAT family N-acetyltransferase n=1 Tax=Sporomusa sp. KB1 TaxID=943346 RepID=UPI0011A8728E|nr:GNAT family N-acetyltransferase [Sporomusa sp. KB1]